MAEGVAVVLSPGAGETFPEGVKFTCDGGKETVPVGGAVFLMANTKRQAGSHTIVMDFTGCGSLKAQERLLCVSRVLPIGTSTGSSAIEISGSRASASYRLRSDDLEGLKVAMADGSSRIVEPGTSVNLSITYYTQKKETLRTGVYRKVNGVYEEAGPWTVSGINSLSEGMTETKTVTVTIPQKTAPGTYRLVFQLGRLEVPYNLIVHDK